MNLIEDGALVIANLGEGWVPWPSIVVDTHKYTELYRRQRDINVGGLKPHSGMVVVLTLGDWAYQWVKPSAITPWPEKFEPLKCQPKLYKMAVEEAKAYNAALTATDKEEVVDRFVLWLAVEHSPVPYIARVACANLDMGEPMFTVFTKEGGVETVTTKEFEEITWIGVAPGWFLQAIGLSAKEAEAALQTFPQ